MVLVVCASELLGLKWEDVDFERNAERFLCLYRQHERYWPNSIFRVYIKPAAKKIGLTKRIGWHTFRHTFGTILNANGENPKVIQELLGHATLKVTMDTYVQAMSDEKRKAESTVVEMIMPGIRKKAGR
jgi:integrase